MKQLSLKKKLLVLRLYFEPDNPLLKMDNVILTAHGASASSRMPVEARKRAALEITRVLRGMPPMNPVNQI